MTHPDPWKNHLVLCNELLQFTLDENRFLKNERRLPSAALLEHRRTLLARLDDSLASLRTASREQAVPPSSRAAIEQAKARTLQILHLERENEQLLLRHCLAPRSAVPAVNLAGMPNLQRAYQRQEAAPPCG
ncbi:MAG: hypothetical protein PHE83_04080 [Opitutaceae bacterium]|nr:hypothetical protein [Opitutaceae bacterium]